jgi:hypothetical protein
MSVEEAALREEDGIVGLSPNRGHQRRVLFRSQQILARSLIEGNCIKFSTLFLFFFLHSLVHY